MSTTTTAPAIDNIRAAAMNYAANGLHVVLLHGIAANGQCSCGHADCQSPGKRPWLNAWQHEATADPDKLAKLLRRWPNSNVGVLLGERSGIIDIECDSAEAEAALLKLFDGAIPATPTFSAKRGKHRLFKWRDDLPQDAVKKPLGIEFRIGGGAKGAQSVFPPSRHASGADYRWEPGLSPADVEPAELPDSAFALLHNGEEAATINGRDSSSGRPAMSGHALLVTRATQYLAAIPGAAEGDRNRATFSAAGHLAAFQTETAERLAEGEILDLLRPLNMRHDPPLAESELRQIVHSALTNGTPRAPHVVETRGGTMSATAGYVAPAAGWRLEIVDSQPHEFRLFAPAWPGFVTLTAAALNSPRMIRTAASAQAGVKLPKSFDRQWDGGRDNPGLGELLMNTAAHVAAPAEQRRDCVIAAALLDALTSSPIVVKEGHELHRNGNPQKLPDGDTVFRFDAIWQPMHNGPDRITRKELSDVVDAVASLYRPRQGGSRKRWYKATPGQIEQLTRMANGGDD